MPVASLRRVILAPARTAPVGSATRPRMRPLAPWAGSIVGKRRESVRIVTVPRHIRVHRARSDGMEPPAYRGEVYFSSKAIACVLPQPCYNPARLEKGEAHCQGEKTRFLDRKLLSAGPVAP